ncbi:unnamed protein product [Parnassius apollo]|uniref:(apollo) hypothetical protein n=1 Tax=Parnassius apollo TaxID=110799 RepID=A0A8S3WXT1_PARAO|nr:unnamed protein product [Parnassius apollo]
MSANIKKCCPNCSQLFCLKSLSSKQSNDNIPLFLKCGHSMCEKCIKNLVKFGEPIECKVCHSDMEIAANDVALLLQNKIKLHQLFPVNVYMLGELSLDFLETNTEAKNKNEDYFLNLEAIIRGTEITQGQCVECQNLTTKMCQQCATILCDNCFNKSHKNFVVFRNHILQNIEPKLTLNNCKVHTEKSLDYYCKDCSKSICMDCLVVGGEKSCKNHNLVSIQEVNEELLEKLAEISPKVDETFRRLTKTAVDIGHLLHNIENETGSTDLTQITNEVEQHFSKLTSIIQKKKQDVIDKILVLKNAEKEKLHEAKNSVANSIKKANSVLISINKSLSVEKIKQANMSTLLEDAKQVLSSPWYLNRNKTTLKLVVNEEICNLINDFVLLEEEGNVAYELVDTAHLDPSVEIPPPPPAPVYPPELPKDVRHLNKTKKAEKERETTKTPSFYKSAPKYHTKSGSISSLNSLHSDSSHKSSARDEGLHKPIVQPVSPFPESHHPRQLYAGGHELVYISHIVSPHDFFVQRACHQGMVEEMMKEFRNAVSLPKPSISHVAEGKLYLVFNKADNLWQRCRVISIDRKDINKPLFHVFCIDFGSTEIVPIDKLRLLPPARVQSPLPFAIKCSLVNCEPVAGSWTSDDAILIQNITDNKQAVIHIHSIRSTSNFNVRVECDVTTYEGGVSLAHALAFHGRARMPNPKLPYPKLISAVENPKLFISNNDFKPKTVEEVYITHIVSPDVFYVRKHHLQKVYEKLCEDLDQNYSLSVNTGSIYLPHIDMVCVVNVEKYSVADAHTPVRQATWARAVVRELPGRGRVRLLLPDCGATLLAHWTALRRILPKFTTLRALATECHLAGVTPINKKWNPNSVALLQNYQGRLLELHVEDNHNRSLGVTLYDKTNEDDVVCINTEMVKYKFAVTFGLFMFNKENIVEEQVITNKSPPKETPRPKTPSKSIKILKNETSPKPKNKEENLEAKDKGPLRLEAKVLYYQSPSLIYVSLVHQQKQLNVLFENIQKYYSKKKFQKKDDWKVGDRCCTICQQSQTWRRAAIVELEGENAKVFYSDFACVETVPVSSLRELSQDFASIGDAAIKCHLSGVIPADGEEWPSLTKEYLKEMLDAYKRVFITKIGNFKDKSMPIEMWVYHTTQGGALEPNTSEWRCLNKKIIEQGLGIPDKSQQINDPDGEAEAGENVLSFLNMTGSVQEWLQLEPMPTKPFVFKSDSESHSNRSTPLEFESTSKSDTDNKQETIFISDWLPPETLQNKEFTGVPTYVDNDGIIYLHDISQEDTLDLIRKALDVRFKNPDPKAKYAKWSVVEFEMAEYTDGSKAVVRKFARDEGRNNVEEHSFVAESDSGPDYIVEEEQDPEMSASLDSFNMKELEGKDWNQLLQEEEKLPLEGNYTTFPKNFDKDFICNITVINDMNILELNIIKSNENMELYEMMFEKLQEKANSMPPLNGIFENKACVALFDEDGQWYRATILEYSENTNRVKVRYIDYGNIEIIFLADVREIDEEFTKLPPLTVSATLHGVKINPNVEINILTKEYENTFLDKGPFRVKVIDYKNGKPSVELRNEDDELVYEHLIESKVFLSSDE